MALASIFDVGERLQNKFRGKFGITLIEVMGEKGIIRVYFKRNELSIKQYDLSNLVAKNAEPYVVVLIPEP